MKFSIIVGDGLKYLLFWETPCNLLIIEWESYLLKKIERMGTTEEFSVLLFDIQDRCDALLYFPKKWQWYFTTKSLVWIFPQRANIFLLWDIYFQLLHSLLSSVFNSLKKLTLYFLVHAFFYKPFLTILSKVLITSRWSILF